MLEKPRAGYRHSACPALQGLQLKPFPRRVFQRWESKCNRYRPREKKTAYPMPVTCYPCKTHSGALRRPQPASGLYTSSHEGRPCMYPSHYLPFRRAAQRMLENTADCVQLFMQIPGTQVGVSRNCSRPRATFPPLGKVA